MCSASAGISARASFRVGGLKVQPVLRRGAERLAEPDRNLSADRARAVHDPRDRIVRHMDVFGELPGTQAESLKFVDWEGSTRGLDLDQCATWAPASRIKSRLPSTRRVRQPLTSSWGTASPDPAVESAPALAGAAWRNSGRLDAEFPPDVGELHSIRETTIRHHRAEFDQTLIGKEEPRRAQSDIEPHQPTVQEAARLRWQLWLPSVPTAAPGLELEALRHSRISRKKHIQFTADIGPLTGRERRHCCRRFAHGPK
jgi:hypothetical protein